MRCVALVLAVNGVLIAAPAEARVMIHADLSSQTMSVSSASGDYEWPISSARFGFSTPRGTFGVQRMEAMHRSHKYHNSPMPYSLFFSGGYAIHGTYETASLGRPASHGCIRIAPENAAALFQMVQAEGGAITITGSAPDGAIRYARRAASRTYARNHGDDDDADRSFGYSTVVAPGFYHWMDDPASY